MVVDDVQADFIHSALAVGVVGLLAWVGIQRQRVNFRQEGLDVLGRRWEASVLLREPETLREFVLGAVQEGQFHDGVVADASELPPLAVAQRLQVAQANVPKERNKHDEVPDMLDGVALLELLELRRALGVCGHGCRVHVGHHLLLQDY